MFRRFFLGRFGPIVLAALLSTAAVALESETVTFRARDGLRITAHYYPPPLASQRRAPVVLLIHDLGSNAGAWEPVTLPLHQAEFAILAVDLRGHADSGTTDTREAVRSRDAQILRDMQNDIYGAYDWLAERSDIDRARVAVVGAGLGSSVALQYAARDRSVDALVCLSPGLDHPGLDPAGDLGQITGRSVLLVGTENERDALYTLKQRGDGHVRVRLCKDQRKHGTDLLAALPDLKSEIVECVKTGVGRPTTSTVYGTINSDVYHQAGSGWLDRIAPSNLRYYSSPQEAETRGLRGAKSDGPYKRRGGSSRQRP